MILNFLNFSETTETRAIKSVVPVCFHKKKPKKKLVVASRDLDSKGADLSIIYIYDQKVLAYCLAKLNVFLGIHLSVRKICYLISTIFIRVSKEIRVYFSFPLLRLVIGLKHSRHFLNQSEAKLFVTRASFPAHRVGYRF